VTADEAIRADDEDRLHDETVCNHRSAAPAIDRSRQA
jgi:hypothetical protein